MDTTDDAFLGGQLLIRQPRAAYRAGLDAVLLAAAVPVEPGRGQSVLDAGAGVGVVGLAIARRVADARVTLVEIEPALATLAADNAARNGLGDRVGVVVADVGAGGAAFAAHRDHPMLREARFDHVAANPPFNIDDRSSASPDALKARANAMGAEGLDAWLRFMAAAAAGGGTATIIHRAEALAEVLAAMGPRFGALRVLPIHPRAAEPAARVIVQGVKGSRAPLEIRPPLVLHDEGPGFRAPVEAILRYGAALVV